MKNENISYCLPLILISKRTRIFAGRYWDADFHQIITTDKKTTEYTEDTENKNSVNSVPSVVNIFLFLGTQISQIAKD